MPPQVGQYEGPMTKGKVRKEKRKGEGKPSTPVIFHRKARKIRANWLPPIGQKENAVPFALVSGSLASSSYPTAEEEAGGSHYKRKKLLTLSALVLSRRRGEGARDQWSLDLLRRPVGEPQSVPTS